MLETNLKRFEDKALERGRLEAARNMRMMGYDLEAIIKVTGLAKDEAEKL